MGRSTPWGTSDHSSKITRGVMFYGTPGHGGFAVTKTLLAKFPACFQPKILWADVGWYEEDCEWARAALALDSLGIKAFDEKALDAARSSVRNWFPDDWEAFTGEKLTAEQSSVIKQREFVKSTADKYVVVAASGDWAPGVPKGFVGVHTVLGGRTESGHYASDKELKLLVPAKEYDGRAGSFVINNPADYQQWTSD